MSVHQASHGAGSEHAHAEDPVKNGLIGVWLGLVALTFFLAVWIGSNAYLRSWSPAKFSLSAGAGQELPYWDTLVLIIACIVLFIAGSLFKKGAWRGFNAMLMLTAILFLAFTDIEFWLLQYFLSASVQVKTAYFATTAIQFTLGCLSVLLLIIAGVYASYRNKEKIRNFFPVVMNVWLYTVAISIVILLVTDVMTVGQFGAWCGTKLLGQ